MNWAQPLMKLTLVSLEVCADTAVKGDWSGSGTSIIVVERKERARKEVQMESQIAVLNACFWKTEAKCPLAVDQSALR